MDPITAIIGGIWAAFAIYWIVSAYQTRGIPRSSTSYNSLGIFFFVVLCAWILLNWVGGQYMGYYIVPETIVSRIGGLFITIAGVGFAMWARIHLGEHWSSLPSIHQEHELIRTGPYRYVRHPIYAGLILGLKGSLVVVNQVWMLVLVLLVITGLVLKIWDEEMILMDEFGEDYLQYKKQAKVLIPFIL